MACMEKEVGIQRYGLVKREALVGETGESATACRTRSGRPW